VYVAEITKLISQKVITSSRKVDECKHMPDTRWLKHMSVETAARRAGPSTHWPMKRSERQL
jgi:hypothetical protein